MILTDSEDVLPEEQFFGARNAPPERRECLARTGSPTSGDRGQVEIQSFCHESRSRVDQFIQDCRTRPECEARPMPRTRPAAALPKCYRFNEVCGIDTMEGRNLLDRENPIRISHVICHGTRYHQGARRQDMTVLTQTL